VNIRETVTKAIRKARGNGGEPQKGGEHAAPDALTLIKNDHREVDALFEKALADDTPGAQRRSLTAKITGALTAHAEMEEALFYPTLRKAGGQKERDSVLEAAEEHGVVKDLIAKIEALSGRDETLKAKLTVLKELVQHHVKEEESEIFSEAREKIGEARLKTLGAEMQRFKQAALYGSRSTSRAAERGTPSAVPNRVGDPEPASRAGAGTKRTAAAGNAAKSTAAKRTTVKRSATPAKRNGAKRSKSRKTNRG